MQATHSLHDVQPQPPADQSAFDFALPMHVFEKADAPEGQKRRFGGICSTDNIDRQGERILQDGLDWSDFFEHGWFNDNHSQKTADVLGYGDKNSLVQFKSGDLLPNGSLATCNGTWVEGYLLNRPACDQIWDLAQSLQGTGRNLGFSVEGNIVKRTGVGNKTIAKAKIRNIALTNCPVNVECKLEALVRSLAAVEAQAEEEDAAKAMGGAGPAVPLANASGTGMTAGRIVATEALEPTLHNNAGPEKLRRKRKKKTTLSRSEAIAYVHARLPGLKNKQAKDIVMRSARMNKAGEGSRGGRIIGHTKSGKPIYASGANTQSFSHDDHADAASAHFAHGRQNESDGGFSDAEHHEKQGDHHIGKLADGKFGGNKSQAKGHMYDREDAAANKSLNHGALSQQQAIAYVQARVKGLSKADAKRILRHSKAHSF